MPSQVQLMNKALRIFAGRRIIEMSDGTAEATICTDAFDDVRDTVLGEFPFCFATRWQCFAREETAPPFGFTFAYALPADFLYLVTMRGEASLSAKAAEYKVAGQSIYTNVSTCYAQYVFTHNNPAYWPVHFCEVFCMRLAAEVAPYLAGDSSIGSRLLGKYYELLPLAMHKDQLQENPPEIETNTEFIDARYA